MWHLQLQEAIKAGKVASKIILDIYHRPFEVEIKSDNSPVTIADKLADQAIRQYLFEKFPTYSFLTEEAKDDLSRLDNDFVWIVDPIDGTKDFVAKNDQFTINIALSYRHQIVVGVIFIPASNEIYYASLNQGAYHINSQGQIERIFVNDKTVDLTVLVSRFHKNEQEVATILKHQHLIKHEKTYGSSIKACQIAHGLAEISYRFSSGTKEWDTAAADIIVKEAGGLFVKLDGTNLVYNRPDVINHGGYIIVNRKENILL